MPLDPISGAFTRIWKFVDRFLSEEEVRRADLDAALDDMVPAINAALAAQVAAQSATTYSGRGFASRAALTADLTLTYASGMPGSVIAGDVIQVYGTGDAYEIVPPTASAPDLTTAAGIKMQYLPSSRHCTTALTFGSADALMADTGLTYAAGPLGSTDPGTIIVTLTDHQVFEVAQADATTHSDTTAGGLRLYRKASGMGPHVILEDRRESGTPSGTFNEGADRTRVLNTEVFDAFDICALDPLTNRFTLPAGSYIVEFDAPAGAVGVHQAMLHDVTAGAVAFRGAVAAANTASRGRGVIHPTMQSTYEIRHRCTSIGATSGFGPSGSFGTEVFARVAIWKVA